MSAALADLADVLLPGGDGWPTATATGMLETLTARLVAERGEAALAELADAIGQAGGPFEGQDGERRVGIAEKLERNEPELFGFIRDVAYLTYYETEAVEAAINARGYPYERLSHVTGYPTQRFDLDRDTPRHGRGSYQPTGAVRPVDVAGLDLAGGEPTNWGLKR